MTRFTGTAVVGRSAATLRQLRHDSTSDLLAAQLMAATAAFATNALAAWFLGPAGRGELALFLQVGYFGSIAIMLGCDRSVVAVYAGDGSARTARAAVRLLRLPSGVALVCAAGLLLLPVPMDWTWRAGLAAATAFMVTNSFIRLARSVCIVSGVTRHYLFGIELASDVLQLAGLGALCALGGLGSPAWTAVYLVAGTIPVAAWFGWWCRGRPGAATPERCTRLPQARREGLQLVPATIARSGTLRIDRILLALLASTTALGLYATVATLTELIAWPVMAYADSRLGRWRQASEQGGWSVRRPLLAVACYAVVVAVMAVVAIRWLLVPIFGASYEPALPLVAPLIAASALLGAAHLLITTLVARGRAPLASAVETGALAVSVLAYVVLIQRWGALGAAYGSLLGYGSCLAAASLALWRTGRPVSSGRNRTVPAQAEAAS